MLESLRSVLFPAGPKSRLPILIFHRVLTTPDPLFPGEVDALQFDAICTWVRRWYQVLPLPEAAQRLRDGTLPARSMAITFDDGYADNHDVALPILRRHGLVATFFVATGFTDGGCMWNDRIIEAIRQCPHDSLKLPEPLATEVDQLDLSSLERRREAIGRLLPKLKYMDSGERVRCADAVVAAAGALVPRDLMMSSAQLVKLALDGMLVGGHTVNHPILAALPDAQAHQEIAFGKRALESLLQRPVDSFAYPNGKPGVDYTARDMALVRDAGYRNAVSTSWGVAGADADLWQLPRFTPWDRTQVRFGLRLALNLRNKVVLCDPMPPGPVLDRPSDDQALRRGFPEAGD